MGWRERQMGWKGEVNESVCHGKNKRGAFPVPGSFVSHLRRWVHTRARGAREKMDGWKGAGVEREKKTVSVSYSLRAGPTTHTPRPPLPQRMPPPAACLGRPLVVGVQRFGPRPSSLAPVRRRAPAAGEGGELAIEVPDAGAGTPLGRVSTGDAEVAVPLSTLQDLLVAVDTYCATTVARVNLLKTVSGPKDHYRQ